MCTVQQTPCPYFFPFVLTAGKRLILLVVLWLILAAAFPVYGQLTGLVQDESHEPLPFASVLLMAPADSSLLTGGITTETGQFRIAPVSAGKYLLAISMTGFQAHYRQVVLPASRELDLGVIVLRTSTLELSELVVTGQKPVYEQQLDRLVVHVQNSLTSAGATALDILERSPGVAVNRQSGTISLNGKEGVGVLINGKYSRMPVAAVTEMLRSMQGSTLEKIELISNPPAEYDAEGAGGVINLVLKQAPDQGSYGSLSVTGGYGYGEKTGTGFTFHTRHQKISFTSSYSFLRDRTWQLFTIDREIGIPAQAFTSTESRRNAVITNHRAQAGLEYAISAKTTLGTILSGYTNKWQMKARNQTFVGQPQETYSVYTDSRETNHWQHLMANLNLTHHFRKGQELRADADYLLYHDSNPSDYVNVFENVFQEPINRQQAFIEKETPIRMAVAKLDYRHSLSPGTWWEAGIKGTNSRFRNKVAYTYQQGDEWISDPVISGQQLLQENIAAAYTSWQLQLSTQTKMVAGLRYEYTHTALWSAKGQEGFNRKYGNFFPNLLLTHTFGKAYTGGISYGRRITRPTFNDLAPFVIFYGTNNFESGNPALQPSLSHTIKGQFQWKNLTASLQYTIEDNLIAGYQPHIDFTKNELYNYAENLKNARSIVLSLDFPWQVTPWWTMQHSILATRQQATADYLSVPETVRNSNIRYTGVQRFLLPSGFSMEISGYYQSPFLYGIYRQRALGMVNIGLQKKLPGEKGTLSLTCDDIFWTTAWRWDYDRPRQQLQTHASFAMGEARVLKLTYTRNFGNKKLPAAPSRPTGSEEEQKRVH